MLTIFRILLCFVVTSVCLRLLKTQFFAIRQDQTTFTTFINTFEARTIHEWICQFMRKTMVQIPSP